LGGGNSRRQVYKFRGYLQSESRGHDNVGHGEEETTVDRRWWGGGSLGDEPFTGGIAQTWLVPWKRVDWLWEMKALYGSVERVENRRAAGGGKVGVNAKLLQA